MGRSRRLPYRAPALFAAYSNGTGRIQQVQMQFLITGVKGGSTRSGGTILCGTWFPVPQVASHVAILGSKFTTATPRFRSRVSCPTRSAQPPCAAVMSSSMVRVVRVRPADRGPWHHSRSTAQNCQDSRSVSRASSSPLMLTRYFSVSSGGSSPEASRQLTRCTPKLP